jgi:hypothetical protein
MTIRSLAADSYLPQLRLRSRLRGPAGLAVAAVSLGAALQVNYGQYHPIALELLAISAVMLVLAVVGSDEISFGLPGVNAERFLTGILSVALGLQFTLLLRADPTAQPIVATMVPFRIGIIAAAVVCIYLAQGRDVSRLIRALPPLIYFGLGLWILRSVAQPPVDVCVFQHDSCRALLHGINPYSIDFPNLYIHPAKMYDATVVVNGRLLFGYPYPPLSLLLTEPGYLLGDFRLANLAAMTLAGMLITFSRPGRVASAAGSLFLFTPRTFFVLEAGFTEPIVVMLFAAVIFAACRNWRCLPLLFGLFVASKQYLILAAPLGLILFRSDNNDGLLTKSRFLRSWLVAGVTAVVVTLPLAVWNCGAFLHSVVFLQFHQPVRSDSLSYLPVLAARLPWRGLVLLPFVLTIAVIVFVLRRFPKTPAAFAVATALVFMVFFATNKQAFCGYYLFVLGALCAAIAVMPITAGSPAFLKTARF